MILWLQLKSFHDLANSFDKLMDNNVYDKPKYL